ncbi:MAG: alpha-galactosidase, partial [Planctomycetota bacterium]
PANEFNEPADYFNWDMRTSAPVTVTWKELGLGGRQRVRDVWRQLDRGLFTDGFTTGVPFHGVVLLRITPEK